MYGDQKTFEREIARTTGSPDENVCSFDPDLLNQMLYSKVSCFTRFESGDDGLAAAI
ncbi:hypothetical protein ACCS45_03965 [Rhizobium ruizarguesonis]